MKLADAESFSFVRLAGEAESFPPSFVWYPAGELSGMMSPKKTDLGEVRVD